jgi:hypothetical protein
MDCLCFGVAPRSESALLFPRRVLSSYQTSFQTASLKIMSSNSWPKGEPWPNHGSGLTEAAAWLWTVRGRCQFLAVYRPCSFAVRNRGLSSDEPRTRTGQDRGLFGDSTDARPASRHGTVCGIGNCADIVPSMT